MYFHKTPGYLKLLYPDLIWNFPTQEEKIIYLTFDDGPVPVVTEFVLDILSQYNAKATFFCVGENVTKNSWLIKKIEEAGHALGNHTQHHLNGWKSKDADYLKDIELCRQGIKKANGDNSSDFFRPPYGRIKRSQIKKLKQSYKIIMWDVLTGDFDMNLAPEKCLAKSIKSTENGSIVIFHDSHKAEPNLRYALPRYLEHFQDEGYKFKNLADF